MRLTDAERALDGRSPVPDVFRDAVEPATRALEAQDDLHATADYRRAVAATLVVRALADATGRARDWER
jgi:CO/xanthine dehydrogenase FAD-binding subunit